MLIQAEHNDFKVKLEILNHKESEVSIITNAVNLMAIAMGDPQFEEFCRNYTYEIEKYKWSWFRYYSYKESYKGFWMNQGLTGFQVYTKLKAGKEVLSDETDYESDIYLEIDRSYNPGVIGYTYPSTKWQWIYQRIIDTWGAEDVAGNLAHEWCHKMGFSHESSSTDFRKHSVPYAVGYYVRDFIKKRKM